MCVRLVAACSSCLETVRRTATLATGDPVCKRVCDIRHTVRRVRWTSTENLLPEPTLAAEITLSPQVSRPTLRQFDRFGGAPYR
jgi:hypothetical protein